MRDRIIESVDYEAIAAKLEKVAEALEGQNSSDQARAAHLRKLVAEIRDQIHAQTRYPDKK